MTAVRVFDPAMCCSTGICGPSVDPQLVRFAADLAWLETQGVSVERFNLAQQPAAFVADADAKAALEADGEAGLPLVKVDGEVKSSGVFPSRDALAAWAGIGAPPVEAAPAEPSGGCCETVTVAIGMPRTKSSGCCGPSAESEPTPKKSGCC